MIEKGAAGFTLQLSEMDYLYFAETIQADPPEKKTPKLRSHRNIQNAKTLLTDLVGRRVAGLDPPKTLGWLQDLFQTIRSDLVMAAIPVASERDAFRIFETLNDRGLRLSVPDLLLNYLMRVAKTDDERNQIRVFWNEMLEQMGRRDINRFLRHMWVSKYGDLKTQDLFSALKAHIEGNSIESVEFTRTCSEECESYVRLLDYDEDHLRAASPYVRVLVRQLEIAPTLPVLLSSYRLLDLEDFLRVVRWLLVFVARYSIISRLDPAGLETVLFGLARDIREMMAVSEGDDVKQKAKACLAHVKDILIQNAPSEEQIRASVAELVLANDEAKYVLGRLANRLQTDTKEVAVDEANLEHIFPKNPRENEWGGKDGHEMMEPYLWHLGNLTMLGERLNRTAANDEYKIKREQYAKKSELQMAQGIANTYDKWDRETIEHRAISLIPLVLEVWDFDNPSRV
jgi:hypothetical protein